MTFWTYMLRCSDDSFYVGHSDDLERRIAEHHAGSLPGYTAERRPVTLVWQQDFFTRDEAREAETKIKSWSRAKKIALIVGDWGALKVAAQPPRERPARASAALGPRPSTSLGMDGLDRMGSPPHPVHPERSRGTATDTLRPESPPSNPVHPERSRGAPTTNPPLIVLVRPQLAENIGKAARAMLNFGLTDLRLVAPRDGWPNAAAWPAASGADGVLAGATVYDTLAGAVADCAHVYATTVRRRGVTKPVLTPAEAAADMRAATGPSAILFGPERSGLETEDVAVARSIITVPINPQFGSLNLAQAVVLVAYEWSKGEALAQPPLTDVEPPAPQAELDGMIEQFDRMLDAAGFYFPEDRAPGVRRTVRSLLTRPGWTAQEVRTMRGMLSAVDRPRPARG